MFLVGGPAFSGTTLLALLLNRSDVVCLDEPDFHKPSQSHRAIPFLRELYRDRAFPERPREALGYGEAVELMEECERAIHPDELGMKTCDSVFLGYAGEYERRGYPVVCIVRDIRDALVRPLPAWVTEESLNRHYRLIWDYAAGADLLLRYEELVADAEGVLSRVWAVLGRRPPAARLTWAPGQVHRHMLKLERHELLRSGEISTSRVGIWRTAARRVGAQTHETARLMGY